MNKEEQACLKRKTTVKPVISGSEIMSESGIGGRKEPLWMSMETTMFIYNSFSIRLISA